MFYLSLVQIDTVRSVACTRATLVYPRLLATCLLNNFQHRGGFLRIVVLILGGPLAYTHLRDKQTVNTDYTQQRVE